MKLCDFSARFLIAILTLGIGMGNLLLSHFGIAPLPQWINQIDSTCVTSIFSSKSRVHDYAPDSRTITVRTLGDHPEKCASFQMIAITDDPHHIFEATPPTPLDYAVILQHLLDQGCQSVVLTTRMTWDSTSSNTSADPTPGEEFDEAKLSTQALSYQLAQFDRAVIGLPVTRGAVAHQLPAPLLRSIISLDQINGNDHLIPKVNQVTLPTSVTGGDSTLAGFHTIESSPADNTHIPLLAHWVSDKHPEENGLIPSIELLTIMSAHGISPSELHVQCGQHIRLGTTGPVIPIDDYGQTQRPEFSKKLTEVAPSIPADQLIAKKHSPTSAPLCIIHANGEKSSRTNLINSEQLPDLLTLSQSLPTPSDPVLYQKLSFGIEFLIILAITLIATTLITFSPTNRNIAYILTIALLLIVLLIFMEWKQQWFGLTAPALTLISAWIISSQLNPAPDSQKTPCL